MTHLVIYFFVSISLSNVFFVEGKESPYVNIVAVKEGNQNKDAIKALVKALQSKKIKDYVSGKYPNGEVVTVF